MRRVVAGARARAFDAALDLLHLVAGVSYYKAGVPPEIARRDAALDAATAEFLDALYLHGLGEFAYHNKLDLRGSIAFSLRFGEGDRVTRRSIPTEAAPDGGACATPHARAHRRRQGFAGQRRDAAKPRTSATAVWIGNSPLIAACAARTGLPTLNIRRELSPVLFEYNRQGAYNGHIPVTAINSAILAVAAVLYGFDTIAFSNERSASSATLEYDGQPVNHQWSKGWAFERASTIC